MTALLVSVAAVLTLAACQTTDDAVQALNSRWVGQPADQFFIANGPPLNTHMLDDGGRIYTWRGGERTYTQPAVVQQTSATPPPAFGHQTTTTKSRTEVTGPGSSVTRTTTRSVGFSIAAPSATTTEVIRPARTVHQLCEAQINADADGIIRSVRILRDTEGDFSLSRCADIFAPS